MTWFDISPKKTNTYKKYKNKYLKKCLTLLIIREIKVKTYHLTNVRMSVSKKKKKKREIISVGDDVVKLNSCALLVGTKNDASAMENSVI